ncbi:LPS translocon maturation chaperone LptM [Zymobacter palmae]|uniref:Predicted small periplasmic lipoprotein n=1 Tax=Zymobacter palmae TaxID=33074 RepID=A0A348HHR7_9GAMM|nr:lipoprotein [Zymobacter palmae]BBG31169.1 predicted small periplasmic lipoprotein [Zymobacter palmae]
MNTRALAPLTAALVMLTTLAGCGQTGPLYMPDDQTARTKYDPANDYQLPAATPDNAQEAPKTTAPSASSSPVPARSHEERPAAPAVTTPIAHKGAVQAAPTPEVAPQPQTRPQVQPVRPQPSAQAPAPTPAPAVPTVSPAKKWSNIEWTPYRAGVDQ